MESEFQVLIPDSGVASEIVDRIDEDTFLKLKAYSKCLESFFEDYQGYWIFQSNVASFDSYLSKDHSKTLLRSSLSETEREIVKIQVNRKFLNILSSFRSFIDHAGTTVSRQKSEGIDLTQAFKEAQSSEYDQNEYYRFLWELRNFAQHCSLPISGYKIKVNSSENGLTFSTKLAPYIDSKFLLEQWSNWKPVVKTWLEKRSEIYVTELIQETRDSILNVQKSFLGRDIPSVEESLKFISHFKAERNLEKSSIVLHRVDGGKPSLSVSISLFRSIVAKSFLADQRPLAIRDL